ncbi:MAG: CvpA family protein, partial [Candidatus Cryptobacteroides sp.]
MNILDAIILICFIPALVQGIRKGFIAQVIAIVSIVAGIWLSFKFSNLIASWLGNYIQASGNILQIVAFALILILVILGLTAVGKLLEATTKIVMLGWLNKLLG